MEVFENGNAILQPMLDQGGTIDIRHVFRDEQSQSQAETVQIDRDACIEKLTVHDLRHTFRYGQTPDVLHIEGNVDTLIRE